MTVARKFRVTKLFTAGLLAGLTHTETTDVEWSVGQVVSKPVCGSPYKILTVETV
jgi:hypothetical protein